MVDGAHRTYRHSRPSGPPAPLLVVLHGSGSTGKAMAVLTGLGTRAPAAGFSVVFPDCRGKVWHNGVCWARNRGVDDERFIAALVKQLVVSGMVRGGAVFLIGISAGASFAEHLARHALVPAVGVVLVGGTATESSRHRSPSPASPAALLSFQGTADPYDGGQIGSLGLLGRRFARLRLGPRRTGVAVQTVAADWAAVNGHSPTPSVERLACPPGRPPVTRLSWEAPDCRPVVLYRIDGAGHGWPGAVRPRRGGGHAEVASHLDATDILLEMAKREVDVLDASVPDEGDEGTGSRADAGA